jgi:hypothetical protein
MWTSEWAATTATSTLYPDRQPSTHSRARALIAPEPGQPAVLQPRMRIRVAGRGGSISPDRGQHRVRNANGVSGIFG